VTAAQVQWALSNGFVEAIEFCPPHANALSKGRSVVIHSQRMSADSPIGPTLGKMLRDVLLWNNVAG